MSADGARPDRAFKVKLQLIPWTDFPLEIDEPLTLGIGWVDNTNCAFLEIFTEETLQPGYWNPKLKNFWFYKIVQTSKGGHFLRICAYDEKQVLRHLLFPIDSYSVADLRDPESIANKVAFKTVKMEVAVAKGGGFLSDCILLKLTYNSSLGMDMPVTLNSSNCMFVLEEEGLDEWDLDLTVEGLVTNDS